MIRSRFRALVVLTSLMLIVPLLANAAMPAALAQDTASPIPTATAPPPLADAMPAGVQAYVASAFDLDNDQFTKATGLTARILIPGAGDTISSIVETLSRFIDVIPEDTRSVLEGEIGLGAMGFQPLDQGDSLSGDALPGSVLPAYAIVLHPKQAGDARQIVESWYTAQLEAKGLTLDKSEVGSVVVLKNPDPSTASFPTSPAVVVFVGDYILMGESYDDMLPFVDAAQGTAPTLADSSDLQQLNGELPAERLLFGYLSGETLTDSAAGLFNSSTLAESIDPPFGTTAFTISADDPGFRFESVSKPVQGTTLRGSLDQTNPDFAAQIPGSTLAMYAGTDLGESWLIAQIQKVLLSVLMSSLGAGEIDLTDTDIDTQFGVLSMLTGINFKTDLMDQLQGDYGAALFSIDTENPLGSSVAISSELKNPDLVKVGVTSLGPLLQSAAAGQVSITTGSVADQTINNVTIVNQDMSATIQYGVVNDDLLVGLGDGLSTLAETPSTSLADDPAYQSSLAELPQSYSSVVYVDLESVAQQLAPYLIETLAAGSDNPIAQCLAQNTTTATPVPAIELAGSGGLICSLIGTIFGDNSLQDFLVSRVPGPITAVSYQEDGLQHISGILIVGADQ